MTEHACRINGCTKPAERREFSTSDLAIGPVPERDDKPRETFLCQEHWFDLLRAINTIGEIEGW